MAKKDSRNKDSNNKDSSNVDSSNVDSSNVDSTNIDRNFSVVRTYVKNASFDAPDFSEMLTNPPKQWQPDIKMDIDIKNIDVKSGIHEVVLHLSATAKNEDNLTYKVDVEQAGLYKINGFDEEGLKRVLGSFCPNLLYPYAQEVLSNMVARGGFPQLNLVPINFDALYQKQQEQAQTQPQTQ